MSIWFLVFYYTNPQVPCIYLSKHGGICKSLKRQYRLKIMSVDFLKYEYRKRSFSLYRFHLKLQNMYNCFSISCRFMFFFSNLYINLACLSVDCLFVCIQ